MSDRVTKLQKIASSHSDPKLRERAEIALAQLGATMAKNDPIIAGLNEKSRATKGRLGSEAKRIEGEPIWANTASDVRDNIKEVDRYIGTSLGKGYNRLDNATGGAKLQSDEELDQNYNDLADSPGRTLNMMANDAANAATVGGWNAAGDFASDVVSDVASEATGDQRRLDLVHPKEDREKFHQDHPFLSDLATGAGSIVGAPLKAATYLAGKAGIGAATGAATRLGRAAVGAGTGATAGGATTMAQSAIEGDDLETIGDKGTMGAAVGGAMSLGGSAASGARDAIRSNKKIGQLRSAEESGIYESDPMLRAKTDDRLDVLADQGRRSIDKSVGSRLSEERGVFGTAKQKSVEAHPDIDAKDILPQLDRVSQSAMGTRGQVVKKDLAAALDEIYSDLSPNELGKISTTDFMLAREKIATNAGDLNPKAAAPWRRLKEEFDKIAPNGIRAADKRIHGELSDMERINQVLEGSDTAVGSDLASKELARTSSIRNIGGNSQAQRLKQMQIEELRALDPSVDAAVKRQSAARVYKDTRMTVVPDAFNWNSAARLAGQNAIAAGRVGDRLAGAGMAASEAARPQVTNIAEAMSELRRRRQEQQRNSK